MKSLHKFITLSSADRRLVIRVAITVAAIRCGLVFLSFQTVTRFLARHSPGLANEEPDPLLPEKVSRIVRALSRHVPRATCLTQALATVQILRSFGQSASLRIGVAKEDTGELKAHAWVESRGRVVIGTVSDLSRYTVLSNIEKSTHECDFRNSFC